ncbi:hypothetical protein H6A03_04325 [[Clostridium] spiroforme]|nr:hypothetical protein [Thomasclavelia spiroformis]
MRVKEKYVANINLDENINNRNKAPKGKKSLNNSGTRTETKSENKKSYSVETVKIKKIIEKKFGKKSLKRQHHISLFTRIDYLLKTIENHPDSPLSVLKQQMTVDDFATFITYLLGGIGDEDDSYDKFNKKLQREYIKNINLAKYQYCFRYYTGSDYKDYYHCSSLSEYIDLLYSHMNDEDYPMKDIETAIYYYYSMYSTATAFQEKTQISFSDYYFNNFDDLQRKNSLLLLFVHIWKTFQFEEETIFDSYADPLLNILHNTMQEFSNQVDIYFDSNLSVFQNITQLNCLIEMISEHIDSLKELITKTKNQQAKENEFFPCIAVFEHHLVQKHFLNIEKKSSFLYDNKLFDADKNKFKELQLLPITDYLKNHSYRYDEFISFCTNKSNTSAKTFHKYIKILLDLDEIQKLNSSYFGNYSTPQIKVRLNLNNALDSKITYNEFINFGTDSYKFFGKDDGIIAKHLQRIISQSHSLKNAKKSSEYRMDNSNFEETINDEFQKNDTYAYKLTVLLSEKLRRGFYYEADMALQFKKILQLKHQLLELFTHITEIYNIKKQYKLFYIFLGEFLNILYLYEFEYKLQNRRKL